LQAGTGGNVERVARSLFTDFVWAFEITAVLLVLAVVGAVVLARRSHLKPDDAGDAQSGDAVAEGPDGERLRTP
jgi:NADH-quinone oxidoreductase subunit J